MSQTPAIRTKLVSKKDSQERLGISAMTLWRIVKAGDLKPIPIGRRVFFDDADLEAFINKCRAGAA